MESIFRTLGRTLGKLLGEIPLVGSLACILAALFFGFIALYFWSDAIGYTLEGRQATAQVEKYRSGGKGRGYAELTYEADGQAVKAGMRTWLYWPEAGDQIRILYRPNDPHRVCPDNLWRRFLWPVLSSILLVFFLFAGVRSGLQDIRRLFFVGRNNTPGGDQRVEPGQETSRTNDGAGVLPKKGTA